MSESVVKLNVGGTRFWTTRETLLWIPDSFFSKLLSGNFSTVTDTDGYIFIDRDPGPFRLILNYLRTKKLHLDECVGINLRSLRDDAEFYGINPIVEKLDSRYSLSEAGCGGILYFGTLHPSKEANLPESPITCITGDHNWIGVASESYIYCYRYQEHAGWVLKFQSEKLVEKVGRIALNNKYGDSADKLVAVSYGPVIKLWFCSDPSKGLINTFDLGKDVDSLFFIGSSLVAVSSLGRVGVWNSFTKNWQAQNLKPIKSYDFSGFLLFLGCEDGSICYIGGH